MLNISKYIKGVIKNNFVGIVMLYASTYVLNITPNKAQANPPFHRVESMFIFFFFRKYIKTQRIIKPITTFIMVVVKV